MPALCTSSDVDFEILNWIFRQESDGPVMVHPAQEDQHPTYTDLNHTTSYDEFQTAEEGEGQWQ